MIPLKNICHVYNYADDNTLSFSHNDPSIIKSTLEQASKQAIRWFNVNFMKANPSKFQAICRKNISIDFEIDSHVIKTEETVKLLGINFDNKLNFNKHVSLISKKAAQQINVLLRLSKYLDFTSKLRIYESFVASNCVYCSMVYNSFSVGQDKKN